MTLGVLQAEEEEDSDEEWRGWRLLTMAGIFDCWEPPAGGEPLYTYTIITVDASKDVSFIHHRCVLAFAALLRCTDTGLSMIAVSPLCPGCRPSWMGTRPLRSGWTLLRCPPRRQ